MQRKIEVVRVVLDTNIFLRSLIRKGNICNKILELWKNDHFLLLTSNAVLDEIEEVLKRTFLIQKYGYSIEAVNKLIELISQKGIFIDPPFSMKLCRDKNDDKFIDVIILGRGKFLVSEDKDIIWDKKLGKQLFEYGVIVKNAQDFYQIINRILMKG